MFKNGLLSASFLVRGSRSIPSINNQTHSLVNRGLQVALNHRHKKLLLFPSYQENLSST